MRQGRKWYDKKQNEKHEKVWKENMIREKIKDFRMDQIWESGQCFRIHRLSEERYRVLASDRYLEMEQRGEECTFHCSESEYREFWRPYFDLDTEYDSYKKRIDSTDVYLTRAAGFGGGIRILRQDPWEMIVSFLISQRNNIQRIRKCIESLCEVYGDRRISGTGQSYYTFPNPEVFTELPEDELKKCNLGYRSKYVIRTAKIIANHEVELNRLSSLPYMEAREELLKLYGVGIKVADCICLFGLHRLEAFPVDTHIQQALDAHYREGFPFERYRGIQGVIQQYIFYWELKGEDV